MRTRALDGKNVVFFGSTGIVKTNEYYELDENSDFSSYSGQPVTTSLLSDLNTGDAFEIAQAISENVVVGQRPVVNHLLDIEAEPTEIEHVYETTDYTSASNHILTISSDMDGIAFGTNGYVSIIMKDPTTKLKLVIKTVSTAVLQIKVNDVIQNIYPELHEGWYRAEVTVDFDSPVYVINIVALQAVVLVGMRIDSFKAVSTGLKPSFSERQQGLVDSLIQRLSVIQNELWYNYNYGLPLLRKDVSKGMIDSKALSIISSHPDVKSVVRYFSVVDKHRYKAEVDIESTFGQLHVSI